MRDPTTLRTAAVVLAAGFASRFGGTKVAASLDGRPILRHVIDAAVEAGLAPIVVVGPPGGLGEIDVQPAHVVTNPHAEEGLSSSVRLGIRALEADATAPPLDAVVILPGDQPRVRPETIRTLIDVAAARPQLGFVVARHEGDRSPNPVLARRAVWRLADELAGDRGFGPLIASHPELMEWVDVPGENPDIDTPADLRRLARSTPDAEDVP